MVSMELGVSNLVWEDKIDIPLLLQNNITYIEIIIPKYATWGKDNLTILYKVINKLASNGIRVDSTQAVLFGSKVTSFDSVDFVNHIKEVSNICDEIGVHKIILGAPTCRLGSINSINFLNNFHYIDTMLGVRNQQLIIEPNSKVYKGSYFFTVNEISNFINTHKFLNMSTMIDTHNVVLEEETPHDIYIQNINKISHIHVSEIELMDYQQSNIHSDLAKSLKMNNYQGLIVYEAKPSINLAESLIQFNKTYKL